MRHVFSSSAFADGGWTSAIVDLEARAIAGECRNTRECMWKGTPVRPIRAEELGQIWRCALVWRASETRILRIESSGSHEFKKLWCESLKRRWFRSEIFRHCLQLEFDLRHVLSRIGSGEFHCVPDVLSSVRQFNHESQSEPKPHQPPELSQPDLRGARDSHCTAPQTRPGNAAKRMDPYRGLCGSSLQAGQEPILLDHSPAG
jgi:hypothetical protein